MPGTLLALNAQNFPSESLKYIFESLNRFVYVRVQEHVNRYRCVGRCMWRSEVNNGTVLGTADDVLSLPQGLSLGPDEARLAG